MTASSRIAPAWTTPLRARTRSFSRWCEQSSAPGRGARGACSSKLLRGPDGRARLAGGVEERWVGAAGCVAEYKQCQFPQMIIAPHRTFTIGHFVFGGNVIPAVG